MERGLHELVWSAEAARLFVAGRLAADVMRVEGTRMAFVVAVLVVDGELAMPFEQRGGGKASAKLFVHVS